MRARTLASKLRRSTSCLRCLLISPCGGRAEYDPEIDPEIDQKCSPNATDLRKHRCDSQVQAADQCHRDIYREAPHSSHKEQPESPYAGRFMEDPAAGQKEI